MPPSRHGPGRPRKSAARKSARKVGRKSGRKSVPKYASGKGEKTPVLVIKPPTELEKNACVLTQPN